jgi:hypothetical protein
LNQAGSSSSSHQTPKEVQRPAEPDEPPAECMVLGDSGDDDDWGSKWKRVPTAPIEPPPGWQPEPAEPAEPAEPPPEWWPEEDWMDTQTSWEGILRDWSCDPHSCLQLKLLAQVDKIAAADIMWKLTKMRENPIENPSAFVNKCVTQARKANTDRWHW